MDYLYDDRKQQQQQQQQSTNRFKSSHRHRDDFDDNENNNNNSDGYQHHYRYNNNNNIHYHHRNQYQQQQQSRDRSPRSRSRSRERYKNSSSGNGGGGKNFGGGKFNNAPPSKTIMMRQLPYELTETDIMTEFNMAQIPYKDIRLIRNRDTGQSRGFAFVEFGSVDEAQRWMQYTQGHYVFNNYDNKVQLYYSNDDNNNNSNAFSSSSSFCGDNNFSSSSSSSSSSSRRPVNSSAATNSTNTMNASEWDCAKCGIRNFKRRERCFKCGITKEESEKRSGGEGYDHVGSTPCNTLILRGLDALTTEETIMETLKKLSSPNKATEVKASHIARDKFTHVSSGFAFIEMNSIQDATSLLQMLQPHFECDGKQIIANFSKNSFKTALTQLETMTTMAATTTAANNHQSDSHHQHHQQYDAHHHHPQQFLSNSFNSSSCGVQYSSINHIQGQGQTAAASSNQVDGVNSAAAIAQAALQNMHKKQELINQITSSLTKQPETTPVPSASATSTMLMAATIYTTAPDVSKFTYDETSGYYYDYSTGFYYDANSTYYYNPLTQQFMYWDAATSTYVPVTAATTATATATSSDNKATTTVSAKTAAKQPAKTAAQIAKDMERWAETMNKKKDQAKKITAVPTPTNSTSSSSSSSQLSTYIESSSSSSFNKNNNHHLSNQLSLLDNNSATTKPEAAAAVQLKAASRTTTTTTTTTTSVYDHEEKVSSDSESSNSSSFTLQKSSTPPLQPPKTTAATTIPTTNVAIDESTLIDLNKMACLLCKRKFDSIEILNKHVAKSDLHKTNLENLRKDSKASEKKVEEEKEAVEVDSLSVALQYRDRAKERRDKSPKRQQQNSSSAAMTSFSIENSNKRSSSSYFTEMAEGSSGSSVANKMMRKMGWSGDSGIGKKLQGISAPIEASMRQKGAGLGASTYEIDPNDSYKEAVRKAARARFEQMN